MVQQERQSYSFTPTRCFVMADIGIHEAGDLAREAVSIARRNMPKMTGAASRDLQPFFGEGYFGISWSNPIVWYQEIGIRPFTMRALAGKTIPMWIKDPTGEERRKNPRAETRLGQDGVTRVLVFRRAARQGQRKTVMRNGHPVSVPASYPGAPGRIVTRHAPGTTGKVAGQIASRRTGGHIETHIGVRWRHPGLTARSYLHRGIIQAAVAAGLDPEIPVRITDQNWA